MEHIELDIDSYSFNDLLDFFKIDKNCKKEDLVKNYRETKDRLRKVEDESLKKKLLDFLETAYDNVVEFFTKDTKEKEDNLIQKLTVNTIRPTQIIENVQETCYPVNQIDRNEIKQVISIDSAFRDYVDTTTTTDFVVTLPIPMENVVKMKLISLEIPNTFYLYNSTNKSNKFTIEITDTSVPSTTTHAVVIEPGTYYAADIVPKIQQYLDVYAGLTNLRYLIFEINLQSGKAFFRFKNTTEISNLNAEYSYSLSTTKPQDLTYRIYNLDVSNNEMLYKNSALYTFGFLEADIANDISYNNTSNYFDLTYNGYIQGTNVYAQNYTTYMFLSVDDFVGNSKDQIVSCFRTGYLSKNILGRVQIQDPAFNVDQINPSDRIFKERNYFGGVRIRKLHIQLIDKHGDVVDLNNCDLSLALEFTQLYCSKNQNIFQDTLLKDRVYI